jgi:hypothetical protein
MSRFKKDTEKIISGDILYELIYGGYIKPDTFLVEQSDVEKVNDSISTIQSLIEDMIDSGLLEES